MKIVIHTMYYLPDFGSAPILMDELARTLAGAGHEVEVVTTLPRNRGREFRGLVYSRRVEGGVVVKRLWTNAAAFPLALTPAITPESMRNRLAVRIPTGYVNPAPSTIIIPTPPLARSA